MLTAQAAEVWLFRRDVEIEAASLFQSMSDAMRRFLWPVRLIDAAKRAGRDEIRHANLCQELVSLLDPERIIHEMPRSKQYHFENEDALLYTLVSVGCVTESMSTALLLRMSDTTTHVECKRVVREVLLDEVGHSRIGWESLRFCSSNRSVRWLNDSLPTMCANARSGHIAESATQGDLRAFGILGVSEAKTILDQTEAEVIGPGMRGLIEASGVPFDSLKQCP